MEGKREDVEKEGRKSRWIQGGAEEVTIRAVLAVKPNPLTGYGTRGAQPDGIPRRTYRVTLWSLRKPVPIPHPKAIPRSTPPTCCLPSPFLPAALPAALSQRAKGSAAEGLALLSAPFLRALFILSQQLTEPLPGSINSGDLRGHSQVSH